MFPSILVEYTAEDQSQSTLAKRRTCQRCIFDIPVHEHRPNLKVQAHLINRIEHAWHVQWHDNSQRAFRPNLTIRLHVLKRLLGTRRRK